MTRKILCNSRWATVQEERDEHFSTRAVSALPAYSLAESSNKASSRSSPKVTAL
jgi:hypothetical protein